MHHGWAADVHEWLRKTTMGIRVAAIGMARRLKAVSPDQWFLVGFVLLLVVFLFLLIVQPSSVGRGGR
jgi:type II secretory pathway component PulM